MAGSWKHIDRNGEFLGTRLIDNMGDAYEALAECHWMIWELAGKDQSRTSRRSHQRTRRYPEF